MTEREEVFVRILEVLRIHKLILESAHLVEDKFVRLDFIWLELLFQHIVELFLLLRHVFVVIVIIRIWDDHESIQLPLRLRNPLLLLLKGQHIVYLVFLEGLDQGSLIGLHEQFGHEF